MAGHRGARRGDSIVGRRARWTALGAAIAVSVGAGSVDVGRAVVGSGERPVFVAITPCRLMDTRPAPETVGPRATPLEANDTHTVTVHGQNGNCTIPSDAVSVAMNVAAVFPSGSSFLTVYPAGVARPLSANLNWTAGQAPVSNAVTVDIGASGQISFYNLTGTVHLTADIVGYYVDHNHDDRYSPLGHAHDELYAKRQQTLTYNPLELIPLGLAAPFPELVPAGGTSCMRLTTVDGVAYMPFVLPVGALLQRVRVRAWDSNSNQTYELELVRFTGALGGNTTISLAFASAGAGFGIVRNHTLTPALAETVQSGESFALSYVPGDNVNGLCGVEVDILVQ